MKKYIYIFLWIVLGSLLAGLAHAGSEILYINYLLSLGEAPINYGSWGGHYCALPQILQIVLVLSGIAGGFFSGKFFYHVVYEKNDSKKKGK